MKWFDDEDYDYVVYAFEIDIRQGKNMFYFRSDPKKTEHYIYYYPQNKMPYWAENCDIPGGCEFKTAKELFEAKIYDGESIKDRWGDSIVVYETGISEYERKKSLFQTVKKLETPFGDIHVWLNGKEIPFYLYTETYEGDENSLDKPVLVRNIRVDLTDMKKDDVVICGVKNILLEFESADDWTTLYACEDDKSILGLSAIDPCNESLYCYKPVANVTNGFLYRITSDPSNFKDQEIYPFRVLSLATTWLNKADYEDVGGAHSVLFLALT